MDPARDNRSVWKRLRPFERRVIAVVLVAALLVASFAAYYAINGKQQGEKTLVVYTYGSFMAYGANKTAAFNAVFGSFEKQYGVNIVVRTPSQGLLSTLESQKKSPQADIVIGLTNMDGIQAARDGLLVNYTYNGTAVNPSLRQDMGSASSYLTPYEYAYLGIDYNRSVFEPQGGVFQPPFQYFAQNKTAASNLLLENPLYDSTGEGFLLWEIAYYQYVLHQNWTQWWQAAKPDLGGHIYDSWDSAFAQFGTGPGTNLVSSYLTDPAYNQFFGYGNGTGSTVAYHNGSAYGWRTVYCIGIVNGSKNMQLDRAFISHFLSPTVQDLIPENEWMYPANTTIQLPAVFSYAVNQSSIIPLNSYLNASTISDSIQEWELEWQAIMG